MATGASTAAFAVILIDARKGELTQTRRHSRIVAMMGIRQIVLAVNKMDLVDYDEATFHAIVADYCAFAAPLGLTSVTAIPLSALEGDNVVTNSPVSYTHLDVYKRQVINGPVVAGLSAPVHTSHDCG